VKKKFDPKTFTWSGVVPQTYAEENSAAGRQWRGTSRHIIKGREEGGSFDVRYFEVEPGGYTSLERHTHIHSVICVRGEGYAIVGSEVHPLRLFDHLYVAPGTPHQFVNAGSEPFGFVCVVDSERDRPQALAPEEVAALKRHPVTGPKVRP